MLTAFSRLTCTGAPHRGLLHVYVPGAVGRRLRFILRIWDDFGGELAAFIAAEVRQGVKIHSGIPRSLIDCAAFSIELFIWTATWRAQGRYLSGL